MDKILIAIIAAALGAFFTAFFSNRKERNILIEKWMNQLRNEVSFFLGKCEQLRLLGVGKQKNDFSNPIYSELFSSMYRVELLLDKGKTDQKKLINEIKRLRELADAQEFKDFEQTEKVVMETTVYILDSHWKQISSEMKHTVLFSLIKNVIKDRAKKNKER